MMGLLSRAGKSPVRIRRDIPGFVGNRLQHALWREAFALVDEGVCDAESVDRIVKESFGLRLAVLGPMENADLVGLDMAEAIHEYLLPHLSRIDGPVPLLRSLVARGELGMKTGSGFRHWTEEEIETTRERLFDHLVASTRTARDGRAA
jgi:3-hydroxybutyryl-CoA dehydrogenase